MFGAASGALLRYPKTFQGALALPLPLFTHTRTLSDMLAVLRATRAYCLAPEIGEDRGQEGASSSELRDGALA